MTGKELWSERRGSPKGQQADQACALVIHKSFSLLSCVRRIISEVVFLLCSPLMRPYLEDQFWILWCRGDTNMLEKVQSRSSEMIQTLKHLAYRKRLREPFSQLDSQLQEFIPEDRRIRSILSMCMNTWWEGTFFLLHFSEVCDIAQIFLLLS